MSEKFLTYTFAVGVMINLVAKYYFQNMEIANFGMGLSMPGLLVFLKRDICWFYRKLQAA